MRNVQCHLEDDVLTALKLSRVQDMDETLRAHLDSCGSCAQLVELAQALLDDHRALVAEAQVPSSAIVWWRAQMRARREAAEVVTQPITFVHGLILACAAGLTVAAAGFFVPTFRRAFQWMAGTTASVPSLSSLSLPAVPPLASPIVIAVGCALLLCAIFLPLVLYLTAQEEE